MAIFSSVATLALASLAGRALAQGDPEAASGESFNQPTKSWQQWQPKPTYAIDELPDQYMGANRIPGGGEPQSGYNRCAEGKWNQDSKCQTAWINSESDWCIWGPPDGGDVGTTERIAVAYCTKPDHGTRLIPDGTLTSVHFLRTPNYVQVTGTGDFTSIGLPEGDTGGEMDPHGADDLGNPIGGVMYTTANPASNGEPFMVREWTNFMSWNQYCLRACWGDNAAARCEHIYDVMGCRWNMPSETGYTEGIFETCDGDNAMLQGIYDGSTFQQGQPETPEAHPPAASSNCRSEASVSHGLLLASASAPALSSSSSSLSATSTSASDSASTSAPPSQSTQSGMTPSPAATGSNQNAAEQSNDNDSSSNGNGTSGASSSSIALSVTALISSLTVGGLATLCFVL